MLHTYLNEGGPLPATTAEEKVALLTPRIKQESYYQMILENILGQGHKYIRRAGVTDISLLDTHVEIKVAHRYHESAAQLLKYNLLSPKSYLVVVLFGPIKDREFLRKFFRNTCVTHVLYFDKEDNLIPLYRSTGTISPYFAKRS